MVKLHGVRLIKMPEEEIKSTSSETLKQNVRMKGFCKHKKYHFLKNEHQPVTNLFIPPIEKKIF